MPGSHSIYKEGTRRSSRRVEGHGGRGSSTAWGLQQLVMENHSAIRGLKISHRGACALLVDYATRCSGARSRSRGRSVDVEDALLSQGTTSGGRWLRVPRSRKSPMRLLGRSLAIWGVVRWLRLRRTPQPAPRTFSKVSGPPRTQAPTTTYRTR
jgi:hypothetical protein